jgi:hypothetical protein
MLNGLEGSSSIEHVSRYLAQLGIRSFAGEVLLIVSHRASFQMVHFTGPGLDLYMEATRGAVSHPIPLGSY